MTRKHYKLLAEALGKSGMDLANVLVAAKSLAVALKQDNPAFDRDRFLEAVETYWKLA